MNDTKLEKLALLILAGITLLILGIIANRILSAGTVDPNAATTLGVIITGLIAFLTAIVAAVRGYSMNAQLSKVTDQLAASGPPPADVSASASLAASMQDAPPAAPVAVDVAAVGGKPVQPVEDTAS